MSLDELIRAALAEDIGSGDLTCAAVVPADARWRGSVSAKETGTLSGVGVAATVFETVDAGIGVTVVRNDGDPVAPGDAVLELEGPAAGILSAERVALNFLGRLSGVATATRRLVDAVEGTRARILDTRKTTPGLRALEKAAVVAGGGLSHRFGLYDAILIKENHVRVAGGVGEAARRGLAGAPGGVWVEVEVESLDELDDALGAGIERVLLDNMSPEEMREAVARTRGRASLEASGAIGPASIRAVAETGVDYISVGALTHSAPALDLSLLFDPE
ncbi:MAG: carboxylating nicotinate-nucleotide diphosphorylase [Thermoleophilaceae bacterium]|nr:carboxylating nicotinate-nucleotide diphosphorylase [Thermoleophilaceae bacterium]